MKIIDIKLSSNEWLEIATHADGHRVATVGYGSQIVGSILLPRKTYSLRMVRVWAKRELDAQYEWEAHLESEGVITSSYHDDHQPA